MALLKKKELEKLILGSSVIWMAKFKEGRDAEKLHL